MRELLQVHDAGGVSEEELDGVRAVGCVDWVGFRGGEVEAFEVAACGWGGEVGDGVRFREGEGGVGDG